MIWIAAFVVSSSFGFLLWQLAAGPDASRVRTSANLKRGMPASRALPGGSASVGQASKARHMSALSRLVVPRRSRSRLEKLYAQAGRPESWPMDRLLVGKVVLTVVGLLFGVNLVVNGQTAMIRLAGVAAAIILHFLPELLLYSKAQERREKITLELADTLDQMSIAVEAGLGFDAAMVRVAKNGTGALAQELIRTLQDIQVGQTRRVAYEDLVERTQVPDLKQFIRSIIQAEAYGLALSSVLNTQAAEMRLKRRQRAEARAMQIPVKVIFPLMLFILPVLFVVVLAPGLLGMMANF